jgi:hypothetical protein
VQAADFVQLDLEPRDLSTVERRVVEEWLQSGSDRVLLRGEDMLWYAEFFGLEGLGRRRGYWPLTMKDHEVNTDCTDVEVDQVLTSVPAGATVIATAGGYPACGAFDFGLTRVLFFDDAHGNDSRRWYLNFMHWALGLKVPGGADIRVQTAGAAGATEASGLDGVRLKGGDSLTGSVLNESFVVVSPYATLKLEKGAIERMSLSGDGSSPDVIHLRGGDKVSGSLGDVRLRLKLGSDEIVEIERGKIAEVRFRPAP